MKLCREINGKNYTICLWWVWPILLYHVLSRRPFLFIFNAISILKLFLSHIGWYFRSIYWHLIVFIDTWSILEYWLCKIPMRVVPVKKSNAKARAQWRQKQNKNDKKEIADYQMISWYLLITFKKKMKQKKKKKKYKNWYFNLCMWIICDSYEKKKNKTRKKESTHC